MKKIYLLLMLFLGCVGTKVMAIPEVTYDFRSISSLGTDNEVVSSTLHTGSSNTQSSRSMQVVNNVGLHKRFALGNGVDQFKMSNGLYNNGNGARLFSILKLRAGEVIEVEFVNDENAGVDGYSSNTITDNFTYQFVTGEGLNRYTYVMKEDGQLDLLVKRKSTIAKVRIYSPYEYFQSMNTAKGETESFNSIWYQWNTPVVVFKGNITGADVNYTSVQDVNGHPEAKVSVSNIQGTGGAIIVMSANNMMTFTVPYQVADGSKAWNFWSSALEAGRHDDPNSMQYRDIVGGYMNYGYSVVNQAQTSYTQPMTRYQQWMHGQNAYFNSETAGLIFENNDDIGGGKQYGYLNETTVASSDGQRYLVLRKGGKMIIPSLKKGDQVYMYIDHYGNCTTANNQFKANSLKLKVWNAMDALRNEIPDGFGLCTGGSTWKQLGRDQYDGAMQFYAKDDGDMIFEVDGEQDSNYAKICYIRIYRRNDGLLMATNDLIASNGWEFLTTQDPDGTYHASAQGSFRMHTCGRASVIQRFEVMEPSGNLVMSDLTSTLNSDGYSHKTSDTTNPCYFDFKSSTKPNYGCFLLRGKDYDHDGTYCMDYADRVIAVGYLQTMKFPYTWDLTDVMNKDTGNSAILFTDDANKKKIREGFTTLPQDTTSIWTPNSTGGFDMHNSSLSSGNRNWCSGSQLNANGQIIEEAAGLGLATLNQSRSRNGDFNISAEGLRVKPNSAGYSRIFIPGLPNDKKCWIYIRGYQYHGGVGFAAKYLTGATIGDNKADPETAFTEIPLGEEGAGTVELYRISENFTEESDWLSYGNNGSVTENVELVEDKLTVLATTNKPVEFARTADTYVDNTINYALFTSGGSEAVIENDVVITPAVGVTDKNGHLIYDSENVTLTDDSNVYSYLIKTGGSAGMDGSSLGRAIKIEGLPSHYKLTIVAKSQNSNYNRQIGIYSDSWNGTLLAKMNVLNKALSKSIEVTDGAENGTIFIGSLDSAVEFYAIYVEEVSNVIIDESKTKYAGYAEIPAGSEGVTLYLSDILIEKIGISTDQKSVNVIGWASESRNYYIDHSLDSYFNGKTVDAYMVTSANQEQITWSGGTQQNVITSVSLTKIDKPMEFSAADGDPSAAKKTGCIIYCSDWDPDTDTGINLFVPDIHDYLLDSKINQSFIGNTSTYDYNNHGNADQNKIIDVETAGNMMVAKLYKGNVPKSTINDTYTNYVMAYKYTDGDGVSHPTANEEPVERIVRSNNASLKANSAYIQFLTANVKPSWWTGDNTIAIVFDNEEGNADGIETISLNGSDSVNDVYYNLNGQRIDKPTTSGVYVKNGKKVYVK